jgi:glucokinase
MEVFVGIDIGGSHVSVGYIDSTGQLLGSTADMAIDRLTLHPQQLVEMIKSLIEKSKDKDWVICSIGIGCPGWAKNGVIVRASNLPLFQNFNFATALNEIYTGIPVLLLNDADAAVSAEVWGKDSKGRYKDFTNIAMITLGTGVGCGLILNQQLHLGSNGLIEAGHMIVATGPDSRKCPCGQTGCVEAYASAYTTAKRLSEADAAAGVSVSQVGVDGGKEVLARYARGDAAAVKVLEEVSDSLPTRLAPFVALAALARFPHQPCLFLIILPPYPIR